MRPLNKPKVRVEDIYLECISSYTDIEFKEKLKNYLPEIVKADEEYNKLAKKSKFHKVNKGVNVTNLNRKDLENIYTNKLVGGNKEARAYYDEIKFSDARRICPLCGIGITNNLDHYLPKTKYPNLAVSPLNLVPTCSDCNKNKGDKVSLKEHERTIHPYYDDIDKHEWLSVKITKNLDVEYNVQKVPDWSEGKNKTVAFHFKILKLNELFSINAANELISNTSMFRSLKQKNGISHLKELLEELYKTNLNASKSSWKTSLYKCLSQNVELLARNL